MPRTMSSDVTRDDDFCVPIALAGTSNKAESGMSTTFVGWRVAFVSAIFKEFVASGDSTDKFARPLGISCLQRVAYLHRPIRSPNALKPCSQTTNDDGESCRFRQSREAPPCA